MSDDHPLDPLADASVPELSDVTRDRLEAGLRVKHAERNGSPAPRGLPRRFVVAPVIALVLLVATIALVARDEAAVAALELRDAVNVTITLPDGAVVSDPADGFALTDGAVVAVGTDGRVTIDDITLAAGSIVTVRDGRLVTDVVATTTVDRPPAVDATPDRDDPPVDGPTTTTAAPPPASRPIDTAGPGPVEPAPTTTSRPQPPEPTRPPPDSLPAEPPRDEPPRDEPPAKEVAVALRISRRDGGVRVAWNTEGIADTDWRVVVVRTDDGSDPESPGQGTVVGEGPRGEVLDQPTGLPDAATTLRYRVLVIDARDGVVARSVVQSLSRS